MTKRLAIDGDIWRSVHIFIEMDNVLRNWPRFMNHVVVAEVKDEAIVRIAVCPLRRTYSYEAKTRKILKVAKQEGYTHWMGGKFPIER